MRAASLWNANAVTHGGSGTRLYQVWAGMIARCYRPSHKGYPRYGGRGITVCDAWRRSFEKFRDDMGCPPDDGHRYTIERSDNDLGYYKENCSWATYATQARNRATARRVAVDGELMNLEDAATTLSTTPNDLLAWARRRKLTPQDAVDHYSLCRKSGIRIRATRIDTRHTYASRMEVSG